MSEGKNKRLIVNLMASMISFIIQMGISFILTPLLVEKLGDEAYGFIGLANNFVSYATVVTLALNSMASRFITIAMHKNDTKKANEYFSSVFFMNVILSSLIFIVSGLLIINLDSVLNIPSNLDIDVKITFALAFTNFILSLLSTVFTVATFIRNRIDLESIQQIIGNVLKFFLLIILFFFMKPKIYYISIAAIVYTLYVLTASVFLTKKLTPELKIKTKNYSSKSIIVLLKSGVWNSLNNLSTILLSGLDLLIANLFIDASAMGTLSIVKTIPNAVTTLLVTISGVFSPIFTILYSKGKKKELVDEVKFSMKILSLIMIVPLAGFIAFGKAFYTLWLPTKGVAEINQIQILSILTILPSLASSYLYCLYSINTVTNKLKVPVIVTFILGIANIIVVYILLKTTPLGIYAIAGVSSIFLLFRILIFVPIYAACNLNIKKTTFYKPLLKSIIISAFLMIIYAVVNNFIYIDSWKSLIITIGICGVIGYCLTFMLLFDKKEKKSIINKIKINLKEEKSNAS